MFLLFCFLPELYLNFSSLPALFLQPHQVNSVSVYSFVHPALDALVKTGVNQSKGLQAEHRSEFLSE